MPARSPDILTRLASVQTIRCAAGSKPMRATTPSRCEEPRTIRQRSTRSFTIPQQREPIVSIFQRIKAPFTEGGDDEIAAAIPGPRPVGELLRERREELRLDIDGVGEALRIKPAFL